MQDIPVHVHVIVTDPFFAKVASFQETPKLWLRALHFQRSTTARRSHTWQEHHRCHRHRHRVNCIHRNHTRIAPEVRSRRRRQDLVEHEAVVVAIARGGGASNSRAFH